jgi:hypothetical protein
MLKRLDLPLLTTKCPLCGHRNCPECREVSSSILACCECRSRAISQLVALQERQRKCKDGET